MIKIVHIITDLSVGGAQMMLFKLVANMDRTRFESIVISLTDLGDLGVKLRDKGIPVLTIGLNSNPLKIYKLFLLIRILRREKPLFIQTWLYHADLIGSLVSIFVKNVILIWTIHHVNLSSLYDNRITLFLVKLNSKLSRFLSKKIIYCSEAARIAHQNIGFCSNKGSVILNGIDINQFKPDQYKNCALRKELKIPENVPIISLVGRFHPIKGHDMFFKAAHILHKVNPNVHFVLIGKGIIPATHKLASFIESAGVLHVTHLLGERSDVFRIYASVDIATCTSYNESFSLVLGEAMACGIPCVTTHTMATASLIGNDGWVVPIGDFRALAYTWVNILNLPAKQRKTYGDYLRNRIVKHFPLENMVKQYETAYFELAKQ